MFRFVVEVPLRWGDVDSVGVVNHAVYLSLMEHARFRYFDQLGLLSGGQVGYVLASTNVRFRRPGLLGMKTEVAVATRELGTTSFRMDHEVRLADSVLVEAEATLVFVDEARNPRPIPDDVREAITAFEDLGSS